MPSHRASGSVHMDEPELHSVDAKVNTSGSTAGGAARDLYVELTVTSRPRDNGPWLYEYATEQGMVHEDPAFVVIGAESTGKSTFVDSLIGVKITYSDAGCATRCPVEYFIKPSEVSGIIMRGSRHA